MKRQSVFFAVGAAAAMFLSACGTSTGGACTESGDCGGGQTCFADMPGGYCSKECTNEGQSDECPGGSTCATSGTRKLCAVNCQTQADCRTEYECNGVTGSAAKVCRPK
ncbi:MAG TPA: hypothetical protein VE618_11660 [Myxococcaceae bacterium]|nr:hypothetical protein [Myxococcaceae bacterium]